MIIQSVVVTIMGLITLISVPTITNAQETANQALAEFKLICQGRSLIEIPLSLQQLSERQCLYINSCLNTAGGSVTQCYNAVRNINCDMYNGKRYYCPGVGLSSE